MTHGKPKETEEKKTSIFKDYIVPLGSLLIPAITYFAQNNSLWWGNLALVAYVIIVIIFLVVPAIIRVGKKWKTWSTRTRLERKYRPMISSSLGRFKPMVDSHQSDTIWGVWQNEARTADLQKYIHPSYSHFFTVSTWFVCLSKTVDSAKSSDFKSIAAEASAWVQQYASFCRDAYSQFEDLIRSNQLDESRGREVKKRALHQLHCENFFNAAEFGLLKSLTRS